MTAVTAVEVTVAAHLSALGAVGRSGVVVGFRSPGSTFATTAPARLLDGQGNALLGILRTPLAVVPSPATDPTTRCRRRTIEGCGARERRAYAEGSPQERLPIDVRLDEDWLDCRLNREELRHAVQEESGGWHKCHITSFYIVFAKLSPWALPIDFSMWGHQFGVRYA